MNKFLKSDLMGLEPGGATAGEQPVVGIMKLRATVELWQKGKWFLAKVPELDFIAQGRTMGEAKSNLNEIINMQFREMREMGTLDDYLAEYGFVITNDTAEAENEMIGFEKQLLQVL